MAKLTHIVTKIVVEGSGVFPFDMLRYDQCAPASPSDAAAMEQNHGRRRVTLNRYSVEGARACADRWRSFLWAVVEDEGIGLR